MSVRVALVGLGWAGRSIWLPRLLEHSGFEVVAAVDPAAGAAVAVPVFAGCDELRPGEVDLAVVAVPNHLHLPVTAGLLRRGIPVFVEKPVCLSSAEADQLAAAEAEGGAVMLAGSAARYRADVSAAIGLAGELGIVRHLELAWVRARGVPSAGGWFTSRDRAGGGALVDLGWHLLDAITPLLGGARFEQVLGVTSSDFLGGHWRAAWREDVPAGENGDVEDTARGFLVTEQGLSVALRTSWASHEALDRTSIRVEGSGGTVNLQCTFGFSPNRAGASVLTRTVDGVTAAIPVRDEPVGTEYVRQLDELPGLLADPAQRGRAIADTRRTIAVIERFYESACRTERRAEKERR